MVRTVADQFAEVLAAAGVKRIYGIVGDSLNGLTDSLRRPVWAARRGCDFHVRCGFADGLGRPLLGDERQAQAHGVLLARLHGQCDVAVDRCTGGIPGPAGRFALW
jgi:hypothetical protein